MGLNIPNKGAAGTSVTGGDQAGGGADVASKEELLQKLGEGGDWSKGADGANNSPLNTQNSDDSDDDDDEDNDSGLQLNTTGT